MVVEEYKGHILQKTIILPYFDYEVSILYLQDGRPYIPVVELCAMLGLSAKAHLPQWRKLLLSHHSQKLPYRTSNKGKRNVWCLYAGALTFWFACFDWSLVSPERQEQLQQAMDRAIELVAQNHQIMLVRYKSIRLHLFEFLTAYSTVETTFTQLQARLSVYIKDTKARNMLKDLICLGWLLIGEATLHARNMLQDQASIPVIDAVRVNAHYEAIEESALPLFPIVPEKDVQCFFAYMEKIAWWHKQMMNFLEMHGIYWNDEQKEWYMA